MERAQAADFPHQGARRRRERRGREGGGSGRKGESAETEVAILEIASLSGGRSRAAGCDAENYAFYQLFMFCFLRPT